MPLTRAVDVAFQRKVGDVRYPSKRCGCIMWQVDGYLGCFLGKLAALERMGATPAPSERRFIVLSPSVTRNPIRGVQILAPLSELKWLFWHPAASFEWPY